MQCWKNLAFVTYLSYLSSVPVFEFSGAAPACTPPSVENAEYNWKLVAARDRRWQSAVESSTYKLTWTVTGFPWGFQMELLGFRRLKFQLPTSGFDSLGGYGFMAL